MQPRTLGRYEVRGEMGRGNMGVVYRAHDPLIDRAVALKTVQLPDSLSPEERTAFLQRFFLEARIAGKLIHPNIVVTYDVATDEAAGVPFIAMEFIEGETLSEVLRREGRLPWQRAVGLAVPLARALDYAHQHGIVHRDVKPSNVILTRSGTPKIADFGIAKLRTANLTQAGVVLGTPYFMSPEQARGDNVDGRSDLFSLGSLLYNLVAGKPPFDGSDIAAIAAQVLYKDPRALAEVAADVPPALNDVLARAMAKAAADRFTTAAQFAEELCGVADGKGPSVALPLGERTQIPRPPAVEASRPSSPESETSAAMGKAFLGQAVHFVRGKLRSSARWRAGAAASTLLLSLAWGAAYYREDIVQHTLFYEANQAVSRGELEVGESKLEQLVERNPDFGGATELLGRVSGDLVLPRLPVELTVKHHHRLGSCTGELTLRDWGVEYRSSKHGVWQWRFPGIVALERDSAWDLGLQTREEDMLGLFSTKNYNFSLLGATLDDQGWKRYHRLFQYRRSRPSSLQSRSWSSNPEALEIVLAPPEITRRNDQDFLVMA